MTILVRKQRITTDNGEKIRLRYALIRRQRQWGVKIREDHKRHRETVFAQGAADTFWEGIRLLRMLQNGAVTPVSLPEILADQRKKADFGKILDKNINV